MSKGVVIVTGAGRGIGRSCAIMAAARGHAVVVNYASNAAAADEVVAAITGAGGQAVAVKGDVAVEQDVLAIFAAADKLGTLAGLINNAGVVDQKSRVDQFSAARLTRMMAINVVGSILCAREAVRRMSTAHGGKGGTIVNMGSVASVLGSPNEFVDYAASKGAIDSFTIGLAKEVAAEGIRVNAVRPGLIDTEIHASAGVPDRVERFRDLIPMKRGGSADEVAAAVLWLMSDEASYTTGTTITVSGGR
ncbi:SDR family oxidoreductase [Phreatobacter stygius]|uniref:SDR family oxidoreductase n=1 Tax=Phreatobacter stygius TaxID=1940610 RepID=A0A4D7B990_9HYPH|nr:SDR family oxidoreductase [Phreatobacter stygius]QCI66116.1 SDR family oxidoreductase [Phreatobacter stygius]